MKKILKDSFLYFGRLLIGTFGGLGVSIPLSILIPFMGLKPFYAEVMAIAYLIVAGIVLFIGSSRDSYKTTEVPVVSNIISAVLMGVYQILFAKIVKFNMYATGAAYYFTSLYYSWKGEVVTNMYDVPDGTYLVMMLLMDVVYIAIIIASGFAGKKKRLKERENTLSHH